MVNKDDKIIIGIMVLCGLIIFSLVTMIIVVGIVFMTSNKTKPAKPNIVKENKYTKPTKNTLNNKSNIYIKKEEKGYFKSKEQVDANEYNNAAVSYMESGNYEAAIKYFKKAIELDPEFAMAYYNLGSTYNDISEYDLAIENYKKSLEIDPEFPFCLNNLGYTYNFIGKHDLAIKHFNRAIELDINYHMPYKNKGIAYLNKGDYNNAIESFKKAIQVKSDYAKAFHGLGLAYKAIGNNKLADKNFKSAQKIDSNLDDLLIERYIKQTKLRPDFAYGYLYLALLYLNKNNKEQAIQNLNLAKEKDSSLSEKVDEIINNIE